MKIDTMNRNKNNSSNYLVFGGWPQTVSPGVEFMNEDGGLRTKTGQKYKSVREP